jgi:uncharacterized delta-60 repeat protein
LSGFSVLGAPSTFDSTFVSGVGSGANDNVYSIVVERTGSILVGGHFSQLGERIGGTLTLKPHNSIGRLNGDGTADPTFKTIVKKVTVTVQSTINAMAMQTDGSIVIGGDFDTLGPSPISNGTLAINNIGRIKNDGTLDLNFVQVLSSPNNSWKPGADAAVYTLVVQPDGKIIVGGAFTVLGGESRNHIARLNPNGSVENTFNPGVTGGNVYSMALQADGKILLGGNFNAVDAHPHYSIARLNSDGTVDTTFNLGANMASTIFSLPLLTQQRSILSGLIPGKILAGGNFTTLCGLPRNYLGRMAGDGALEFFNPGAAIVPSSGVPGVYGLAVQNDGKCLVVGDFNTLDGQSAQFLGRLDTSGTIDLNFLDPVSPPTPSGPPYAVAMQPDGKILIGGAFIKIGTTTCNRIARLTDSSLATTPTMTLDSARTTVVWTRPGGTAAELEQVTFDSFNGAPPYTLLGNGTRSTTTWRLTFANPLPAGSSIRAMGRTSGGYYNSSSGLIAESKLFP